MANEKHIEMLRAGVIAWNAWRASQPDITPDFLGADLKAIDLSAPGAPDPSGEHAVRDIRVETIPKITTTWR